MNQHWRNVEEIKKPEENVELKALIALIEASKADSSQLMKALIDTVKSIKPQAISIPEPNISVSMDVERIIRAMPKQEAPVVNMDMEGLRPLVTREPVQPNSYEFDIQRDGHGRIKKVIANPIGAGS